MRILLRCICGNKFEDFRCQPMEQLEYIVRPCEKCAAEEYRRCANTSCNTIKVESVTPICDNSLCHNWLHRGCKRESCEWTKA